MRPSQEAGVDERFDRQRKRRLEPDDSKRRDIDFAIFFLRRVRRVIGRDRVDRPVDQPGDASVDVFATAERRVHFEVRVERTKLFVRQRQVVRRDFGGNADAARFRSTNRRDGALR